MPYTLRKITLLTTGYLIIGSLSGCASTEETVEQPDCQPEVAENCESPDRGYDPCLVNKNLPVCKT